MRVAKLMNEDKDENFIRWQSIAITQLSYSINLILTFSVAAIGFIVSLLLNESFKSSVCQKHLFILSLIILLLSGALGVWCTINRLMDFRATARITNSKYNEAELTNLRTLTKRLGEETWGIFWCQIGSFSAGIIILVLSVAFSVD